jgi:hypothetical protein
MWSVHGAGVAAVHEPSPSGTTTSHKGTDALHWAAVGSEGNVGRFFVGADTLSPWLAWPAASVESLALHAQSTGARIGATAIPRSSARLY